MGRPSRFSPEVRARAVRMVEEHREAHASEWGDGERPPMARVRLSPPLRRRPGHRGETSRQSCPGGPGRWGAAKPRKIIPATNGCLGRRATGSICAVQWWQSRQRRRIASAATRMRGWVRGVILVVELRRSNSKKDNVRLSATLDEGEYAKLARLGAELDLSAAWMIRRALSEFVALHGPRYRYRCSLTASRPAIGQEQEDRSKKTGGAS